jgi:cell division septum initiation protein DivIVA
MGQKVKIALIVLTSILVISFVVILQLSMTKQSLEGNIAKLSDENGSLRKQLDGLMSEKKKVEEQINSVHDTLNNLSKEKEDLEKSIGALTAELEKEKQANLQSQESMKPIIDENASLKGQVEDLNSRKDVLANQLAELQTKNKNLEDKLNEVDKLLKEKISQVDSIKKKIEQAETISAPIVNKGTSVELSPIVVRASSAQSFSSAQGTVLQKTGVEGKILAVNNDNGFVVVDLGKAQGVNLGDMFKAYNKNNKAVANLQVIQVRDNISACDTSKEAEILKEGYVVK